MHKCCRLHSIICQIGAQQTPTTATILNPSKVTNANMIMLPQLCTRSCDVSNRCVEFRNCSSICSICGRTNFHFQFRKVKWFPCRTWRNETPMRVHEANSRTIHHNSPHHIHYNLEQFVTHSRCLLAAGGRWWLAVVKHRILWAVHSWNADNADAEVSNANELIASKCRQMSEVKMGKCENAKCQREWYGTAEMSVER